MGGVFFPRLVIRWGIGSGITIGVEAVWLPVDEVGLEADKLIGVGNDFGAGGSFGARLVTTALL